MEWKTDIAYYLPKQDSFKREMEIFFFSLKNISVKNEACLPITSGDCNQWVIRLFTISKETKLLREVNGTFLSYFLLLRVNVAFLLIRGLCGVYCVFYQTKSPTTEMFIATWDVFSSVWWWLITSHGRVSFDFYVFLKMRNWRLAV